MDRIERLKEDAAVIEDRIKKLLDIHLKYSGIIIDAMKYSSLSGGKRLRPSLFLELLRACNVYEEKYLDIACAIEFIHTYSLIHDDLPAMDNDDYRRGTLTSHKKFGENIAILAGDALLNFAYEILLRFICENNGENQNVARACLYIANHSGIYGMIGGQVSDVTTEKKDIETEQLVYIHEHKTAKLIEASIVSAAMLSNLSEQQIKHFENYARNLGLAFQISDDILDVVGDTKKLGKSIGKDVAEGKNTFPKYYGIKKSIDILLQHIKECKDALKATNIPNLDFFEQTADYLSQRNS